MGNVFLPRKTAGLTPPARRQGLFEWDGITAGNGSHSCFDSVQTVRLGAGKAGSAKAPTATLIVTGCRSLSQNTFEPQAGQK